MKLKSGIMIIAYLLAIVVNNLIYFHFGDHLWVDFITSFVFISFDLAIKDFLQEKWQGRALWLRMFALIISGSALTFFLNREAGIIAIASCIAFLSAGFIDTLIYQALIKKGKLIKINGSNLVSSVTDSIVFTTVAFMAFNPLIILVQFLAKLIGGFVWGWVIIQYQKLYVKEGYCGD